MNLSRLIPFWTMPMIGLFLGLCLTPSLGAESWVEGKIGKSKNASGLFDLRVEIWDNRSAQPTLFQTIEIPRVMVDQGRFKVSLTTSLESASQEKFSIKIQSRLFESWKPFQPAELSRFHPT